MDGETIQLGYRELAERLGISADAARMKAKRAAKRGRWRIIPGNHPSDRVLVELPLADLNVPERVGGDAPKRPKGERQGGEQQPERATDPLMLDMVQTLRDASAHIAHLTEQMGDEKDAHRQTATELGEAKTRAAMLSREVERLQIERADLEARIDDGRGSLEWAAAEIERLETKLASARRSWWRRLIER
ncbi:hypothetical protein [Altericroceibacterium xinjiangense]|uniref:hypothetical protein n=1 Tax=Altericroceibacterium xinjiangense TaxID=762261 RepID=UPI000F7D87BC|nr:hypothetical protein [Altericroceibacterium xinjiangense]